MAQITRILWTPLALADLEQAREYILRESASAADEVIEWVERALDALTSYPEIGRPGRVSGTRELFIARTPFLLAYRTNGDALEILAFMHGARRWPDAFG